MENQNNMEDQNKNNTEPSLSIEETFEALEDTIRAMEAEGVSLEDSFSLYARGMQLIQSAQSGIDSIEAKLLKLNEDETCEEFHNA